MQVDGPLALEFLNRLWRPNQGDYILNVNAIRYGFTQLGDQSKDDQSKDDQSKGESIVVCRTGQQRVEIHCHGGRLASETILHTLVSYGAIEQASGSSNRIPNEDAIISEAREDLVKATTLRSTSILLDQMRGALQREFDAIHSKLHEGDLSDALTRLRQLANRANVGRHLIEPWQVVLAGPPNSGKSSLLNLLLGYSRAIVHDQAGTTRDLLSERSSFDGWPIELIDGAGIRASTDAIEATGVQRTLLRIASADCVLLLVDKTTGWSETHEEILRQSTGTIVLVLTKADLGLTEPIGDWHLPMLPRVSDSIAAKVDTSSVTGKGLKELMEAIVMSLVPRALQIGEAVPFRERHREMIASLMAQMASPSPPPQRRAESQPD